MVICLAFSQWCAPFLRDGVRSDSKLPFKVEFSLDGANWTTSAAFYFRDANAASSSGAGSGGVGAASRRCCGLFACGGGGGGGGRGGEQQGTLAAAGGALMRARAWLVYSYLPFDLSLFGRLRSPNALLVQVIIPPLLPCTHTAC